MSESRIVNGRRPTAPFHTDFEGYNLGQIKMRNELPSPQINDEIARNAKRAIFSIIEMGGGGGRGGLNFSFDLSKIVAQSSSREERKWSSR